MVKKLRIVGGLSVLLVLLGTLLGLASPASGADGNRLAIREVDSSVKGQVSVEFLYTGNAADLKSMSIREDGKEQQITSLKSSRKAGSRRATVWVVDTSSAMNTDGTLAKVQAALEDQIGLLEGGDQMALVTYNDSVVVESELTASTAQLVSAVDGIKAPKDGARNTYDALLRASTLFSGSKLQPNVVLITAGPDDGSSAGSKDAGAGLGTAGSSLVVVDLAHAGGGGGDQVEGLVDRYGGVVIPAEDGNVVSGALAEVTTTLDGQYVATYSATPGRGGVNLSISVGGVTKESSYVAGAVSVGSATEAVAQKADPFGPDFIHGTTGMVLIIVGVGLAIGLAVFATGSLVAEKEQGLTALLRPYEEGGPVGDDEDRGLAQTAILQRAVELTEDFAERQGFLNKIEALLEQADLPLRAAEALFFYLAGLVIVSIASFALFGLGTGLILVLVVALLPPAIVNFMAGQRRKKFMNSLPDMLHLLSGSLRAGYSLMQGVEAVSQEVEEPMGKELRRVVTEARLGREVETALEAVAERMDSADFAWAVMAIRIQREVGGNLSELLLTVADTMVHRERLRRDIAALTAEGRMSAIILGILPIGLGLFMYMSNPTYMKPLFSTGMGQMLLGLAFVSGGIGFAWMKKTIDIKI